MADDIGDNNRWIIFFIVTVLADSALILWATITENYTLIYIFIVGAVIGAYFLLSKWNKDERTDTAIDDASRTVITYFFFGCISIGTGFIIYSQFVSSILWEIGATLIVAALFLFYLQAAMSAYYEHQTR